ncbi:hypothetical protein NECAME_17703 [Necator americanus]|uniref:ET module n=1 Tax=Necator americanus TaxID=51031 RepID=W2TN96_NECAM|nr:hypothetical protein NECAME_17703 [Necator americanus]ETN82472.1 hypothetical protein NECAME_17703 [Necator americanus]
MLISHIRLLIVFAFTPIISAIMCYNGTVTMINNRYPQGVPVPSDCGTFVQYCTKNLLNQRQQNGDTLTNIVYGCDTSYRGVCRYDGCTYSFNGGASCCCDSYLCNASPHSIVISITLALFITTVATM